jgi:hypothetical protein
MFSFSREEEEVGNDDTAANETETFPHHWKSSSVAICKTNDNDVLSASNSSCIWIITSDSSQSNGTGTGTGT